MRFDLVSVFVLLSAAVGVQADCNGYDRNCGTCNGSSCNVGLWNNQPCCAGTSCIGDGGGDGAYCGSQSTSPNCYNCPVKT